MTLRLRWLGVLLGASLGGCVEAPLTMTLSSVAPLAVDAQSVEVWILSDPSFSGDSPSCEALLAGTTNPWELSLARRPLVLAPTGTASIDNIPAQNVVFFVRLLAGPDGTGAVVGRGCSASTRISRARLANVAIEVNP